jgi:hypothetical protein
LDYCMSNVKIKANASGTADFTIEAPATDSALTLTLPSVAGELLTTTGDGSGLTGIESFTKSASDPTITTNGTLGDVWVNTTSGEMYVLTDATTDANTWTNVGEGSGNILPQYATELLVVAGGGGCHAASGASGGSGGGGYLEGSMTLQKGTAYNVTVGAGGAGSTEVNVKSSVGANSVFNGATADGGGIGARNSDTGLPGGSGGGAGGFTGNGSGRPNTEATQTNSGGLTGYGNTGGTEAASSGGYGGSGGGGAGAVGGNWTSSSGGSGGAGRQWVNGSYYAGGGGGGFEAGAGGSGGVGGGGTGGYTNPATAGSANTGGGAGGASGLNETAMSVGVNGGSGIVIIRYAGSQRGTGGTVTSSDGYTYHTFTSSGTYTA